MMREVTAFCAELGTWGYAFDLFSGDEAMHIGASGGSGTSRNAAPM